MMAQGELVVFTSGFPTPRLIDTLVAINRLRPDLLWRHWETPMAAVCESGGSCELVSASRFSCFAQPLSGSAWPLSKAPPLQESERHALRRLRQQLATQDSAADIEQACELIDVPLEMQIKVEQERFLAADESHLSPFATIG